MRAPGAFPEASITGQMVFEHQQMQMAADYNYARGFQELNKKTDNIIGIVRAAVFLWNTFTKRR